MTMVTTRPEAERPPRSPEQPETTQATQTEETHDERAARTWRPGPRLLWALTALFLLTAVAVTATLGRATWQQQRDADNRAAALAAGRQIAVNFVTMNAATFDADTKRVLDASTGSFQKEYASTLAQLKPVVTANKTVSTVERAEASLVSGDEDSAKVIVGVVAPTSNASTPKAEKKTYRLRLDLVKVGDAWKVSNLDFVS